MSDTYYIYTGGRNRLVEMNSNEKKHGHYKTSSLFLFIASVTHMQKLFFPWMVNSNDTIITITGLSHFVVSVLPQCHRTFPGLLWSTISTSMRWKSYEGEEKLTCFLRGKVLCHQSHPHRTNNAQTYHRRNVHRYCTFWLFPLFLFLLLHL